MNKPDKNLFYLASTGRSGTTYLRSLLNSHPDITGAGEILNPGRLDRPSTLLRFWSDRIEQDRNWLAPMRYPELAHGYVSEVIQNVPAQGAFGYDLKLEQLDRFYPWAEPALFAIKPKIIFLRRANLLKQAVSFFLMQERVRLGQPVHGSSAPERMPITVEPARLLGQMRSIDRIVTSFARRVLPSQPQVFHLTYEEFSAEPEFERRLGELQDFLGVERADLRSEFVKQSPDPVEDILTNYSEVREEILKSEFSHTLFLPG